MSEYENLPENWDEMSNEEKQAYLRGRKGSVETRRIEVEVSSEQMEQLLERVNKAEQERDDYKNKLQILAEQKFEAKKAVLVDQAKELGMDVDPDKLTNIEELRHLEGQIEAKSGEGEGLSGLTASEGGKGGAGRAPLEGQSGRGSQAFQGLTGEGKTKEECMQDLISKLRDQAKSADPEVRENAKKILDELWKGSTQTVKREGLKGVEYKASLKDLMKMIHKRAKEARTEEGVPEGENI